MLRNEDMLHMMYTEKAGANFDLFTYHDTAVNLVNFTHCLFK
jgi:hypothetical protein